MIIYCGAKIKNEKDTQEKETNSYRRLNVCFDIMPNEIENRFNSL